MAFEALRGYVQAATGLTEMTTSKARMLVRELLTSGETGLSQMSDQVDRMAKELVATGKANRDQLDELITSEVSRLLGALDLARGEDVDRLQARVEELEAKLAATEEALEKVSATPSRTSAKAGSPGKSPTHGRTAGKAGSSEKAAVRGPSAAKADSPEKAVKGATGERKPTAKSAGKDAEATSAAPSDTVKASMGKASTVKAVRTPRSRSTTKTAKSTSGGGA